MKNFIPEKKENRSINENIDILCDVLEEEIIIVNDKSFFLLSLVAPIFAACKRRFTLQKSCASPGGAIVNGNYFCRLL